MKTTFLVATMAVAMLCSCSAECENPTPEPANKGSEVVITFDKAGGQFDTRAFFDDTMVAEPYEKEIKSAMIYVFDPQGAMVMRKEFSAQEISSLSGTVFLPNGIAGQECTFYAVANYSNFYHTNLAVESDLLKTYDFAGNYNGDFDIVSAGQKKTSGLTMSAVKKAVVRPQGTATDVSFVLKRIVAKVAVKVSVDEKFALSLGKGKIFVNSIGVSQTPTYAWIFPRTADAAFSRDYTINQNSKLIGTDYCNLFYLPEMMPSDDERVTLRINATFDADGNTYTTDDQIALMWDVLLEGSGGGEIRRNGYYRISAVIQGFDALKDVKAFFTAGEWESPVTPDAVMLY